GRQSPGDCWTTPSKYPSSPMQPPLRAVVSWAHRTTAFGCALEQRYSFEAIVVSVCAPVDHAADAPPPLSTQSQKKRRVACSHPPSRTILIQIYGRTMKSEVARS